MKIYVLEDEESIRELILYTLDHFGHEAMGFERPSTFWESLDQESPDLLILDLMLPEEDGLDILKKLRRLDAYQNLPIIVLTAKDQEYDTILGLDSGADEYIAKPVGMMELMARIRALMRRASGWNDKETLRYAGIEIDRQKHEVSLEGQRLSLTNKEFDLLEYFLENRGFVISRESLLDAVWGFSFVGNDRTVDSHIRSLRKKLGNRGSCIQTVRGLGYKFACPDDYLE